jgi:hypothetical protein
MKQIPYQTPRAPGVSSAHDKRDFHRDRAPQGGPLPLIVEQLCCASGSGVRQSQGRRCAEGQSQCAQAWALYGGAAGAAREGACAVRPGARYGEPDQCDGGGRRAARCARGAVYRGRQWRVAEGA